MKRGRLCLLFFLLIPWFEPGAGRAGQTPDHPLTLREALDLLHARNPVLNAARTRLEEIAANEITAGLRPNPVLTSANEDFNVFNPSRFDIRKNQEFTQNVLQTIERRHKRDLRVESARKATTVLRSAYRETQRGFELAVESGFVAMLLAKSNRELARDNLREVLVVR